MILRKSQLHTNTIKQTHAAFYKHLLSYEHLIAVQVNFKIKKKGQRISGVKRQNGFSSYRKFLRKYK